MSVLERLFPRERDFFPAFDRISDCLSDATVELLKAIETPKKRLACLENSREIEQKANRIVRENIEQLHHTFVTPFDRIHMFRFLILHTEIVSSIRLLTEKLCAYEIDVLPLESIEIIVKCGKSCGLLRKMVGEIRKIKNPSETLKTCVSLYEIVAENNLLAFQASKELFSHEDALKKMIIIQDLNQDLICISKKFGAISFLIEEIILERA